MERSIVKSEKKPTLRRSLMHKIQKSLLVNFTSYTELIMFQFQRTEIGSEVSILRNKNRLQWNLGNNIRFKTEFNDN